MEEILTQSNSSEDKNTSEGVLVLPKKQYKKKKKEEVFILPKEKLNEVWLSVSEASRVGGVQTKTIRRAIQSSAVKYKIVKDRYLISFTSLIHYLCSNKKLKNKLYEHGIGQYIDKWR